MPRWLRDSAPGFHHVWVNATGNWPYFIDEVDRVAWVRGLVSVVRRRAWACVGFCQMSTHVHLLLHVPDESLSVGMRDLNRDYSTDFNARHERNGVFVRRRFGSRRVEDAGDLLGVYGYVVLNPVSEHLCLRPEEWRWSSYRTTLGMADDFPFVDAGCIVAEAGGTAGDLRRAIESIARARTEGTRPGPGPGRVLRS